MGGTWGIKGIMFIMLARSLAGMEELQELEEVRLPARDVSEQLTFFLGNNRTHFVDLDRFAEEFCALERPENRRRLERVAPSILVEHYDILAAERTTMFMKKSGYLYLTLVGIIGTEFATVASNPQLCSSVLNCPLLFGITNTAIFGSIFFSCCTFVHYEWQRFYVKKVRDRLNRLQQGMQEV